MRCRRQLLILDPFVRPQRADENDARQVVAVRSALRELSRAGSIAVALVHHVRKNGAAVPGQALRGFRRLRISQSSSSSRGRRTGLHPGKSECNTGRRSPPQAENARGLNACGLVMLALLPVALITYRPWPSA